jgi:5-methylcytosine-specific restriction endonuclease McrA
MIKPIQPISFGYSSILKDHWRKGRLPSVKKDVYGDELVNITIEHIIPKSKGGATKLFNFALANEATNNIRGNKPILEFTTKENLEAWYKQFKDIKLPKFNGNDYIKQSTEYLAKNGIKLDIKV